MGILLSDEQISLLSSNEIRDYFENLTADDLSYYKALQKQRNIKMEEERKNQQNKNNIRIPSLEEIERLRRHYKSLPYNDIQKYIRKAIHPLLLEGVKTRKKGKFDLVTLSERDLIPNRLAHNDEPSSITSGEEVLYIINHSNFYDSSTTLEAIENHFYFIAGDEIRHKVSGLLFSINGVRWVTRADKNSKTIAKNDLILDMVNGNDGAVYAEATWNLSPNNIMLPMHWGAVDMAAIAGKAIVPVILEYFYDDKVCYSVKGEKIYLQPGETKSNAIQRIRDKMATLRWMVWEHHYGSDFKHTDSKTNAEHRVEFEQEMQSRLDEYPFLDYKKEQEYIFQPDPFHQEFHTVTKTIHTVDEYEPVTTKSAYIYKADSFKETEPSNDTSESAIHHIKVKEYI